MESCETVTERRVHEHNQPTARVILSEGKHIYYHALFTLNRSTLRYVQVNHFTHLD